LGRPKEEPHLGAGEPASAPRRNAPWRRPRRCSSIAPSMSATTNGSTLPADRQRSRSELASAASARPIGPPARRPEPEGQWQRREARGPHHHRARRTLAPRDDRTASRPRPVTVQALALVKAGDEQRDVVHIGGLDAARDLGPLRPVSGDQPPIPAQQRLRSDRERRPRATREHPAERSQQQPVARLEPRSPDLPPQDRQLVAQHQDLQLLGALPAPEEHHQRNRRRARTDTDDRTKDDLQRTGCPTLSRRQPSAPTPTRGRTGLCTHADRGPPATRFVATNRVRDGD
jgi:hypothetical protein